MLILKIQPQKVYTIWLHLYNFFFLNNKIIEMENRSMVPEVKGKGGGRLISTKVNLNFLKTLF